MESSEGLRLGRFYCQERLGAAGPLETWRARLYGLAGLDRPFSIKRLRPDADAGLVARFLDAARLASGVEDRRLARIVEVSEGSGQGPFVAAEFVHGVDLRQLLDAARSVGMPAVPPDAAAFVGARMAEALAVTHGARQPIAHGGLGPGNVIVTARGEVRLLDVATAGALRAKLANAGAPVDGSARTVAGALAEGAGPSTAQLRYTAPEVLAGAPPTPAADLYALGILLYEMVSGGRAFAAQDVDELRESMRKPPSAAAAPDGLRGIIDELLSFEPTARSHAAADVAARLDAMLPPRSPFADVARNLVELVSVARRRASAMRPEPVGETVSIVAEPSQSRPEAPPPLARPTPPVGAPSVAAPSVGAPSVTAPSADVPNARHLVVASPAKLPEAPQLAVAPRAGSPEAPPFARSPSAEMAEAPPAVRPASAPRGEASKDAKRDEFAAASTLADEFPAEPTHADREETVDERDLELVYEPPPLPGHKPPAPPMQAKVTRTSVPVPLPDGAPHPTLPPFDDPPPPARAARVSSVAPSGATPLARATTSASDAARLAARMSLARSTGGIARVEAPSTMRRVLVVLALAVVGGGSAVGIYFGRGVLGLGGRGTGQRSRPLAVALPPTAAISPPQPGPTSPPAHAASPAPMYRVPARAADGRIVIRSKPVAATVWIDGDDKGETPIDVAAVGPHSRVVLVAAGHAIWRKTAEPGDTIDVELTPLAAPASGGAGLKVRCHTEGKFPVLVDGKETGQICPTERIGVAPGEHEVSIFVPADDKPHSQTDTFEEASSSRRVYFRY